MKKKDYLIILLFFVIDLISKTVISHTLILNKSIKIIPKFFYLTLCHNNGAAFSILRDKQVLLIIITIIALFYLYQYVHKQELDKGQRIAFSMITGGILGNLFDRIVYNYVIDFLDFKIFGYNYPVFNLADSFIVIGVIILLVKEIKEMYHERINRRGK